MRKSEVLAAEAVSCLNKALCRLKDIWEEIGIPEDQRLQRTNVVKNHIKTLLDMMIKEEESLKSRLLGSIESCRAEMEKLYLELQLPGFEQEAGISMLQQEKNIRTQVEALLTERARRMRQLAALLDRDRELSDVLCAAPYGIDAAAAPTPEQLESFGQHVANQDAEKARRYAEFTELKRRIAALMAALDRVPESSFEKDAVCEDEDAFCLSRDNIAALELLAAQLRAEVERLEELKLLNIRNVTDAIRSELAAFWDKCFFSAEQRRAFAPYASEDFTEELLSQHDAELQRLKQHHEDHQQLFDGVHQWEDSWRLYLELEKKATDPSRFTNRGGNLLKEEKQRTELHKSLPKLEKKLKAQIDAWESEQGAEFLVGGQKFLQYVEEQWEQHRGEKEKEKQERHLKKSKQTEEDMQFGTAVRTPTKRRLLGAQTPNKSRKFNATSSSTSAGSNSSSRSVYGATACRSPLPRPPLSANKVPASRTPVAGKPPNPRLQGCNKENEAQLRGSPVGGLTPLTPLTHCSMASVASTYSEFVRDFSSPRQASETCPRPPTPRSSTSS
ncbi:protein regulator of cytokinesis 1b isoform X4 [Pseudoliparis swirei]|uniref:protein regulator of cytokinesis 1b isoform X4 n=1 Tax=Pseudoliparis swirei TaxID=2059687 RepID=UPI0024BEB08D|nr:protein regulator of cytokinesis 1b isoform X4 [Pseudoliparis swirei]